jgi:uncharacterized YigZ family protein
LKKKETSALLFMNVSDTYKTIKAPSKGIFREKGSRFIAFASPVFSSNDVKPIIEDYRKEYHDARHHCYAYMIGPDKSVWRVNDDGEPSGTAGKPILGQINSHGLTNILIVVIRYFGGTLLGVSGLINAYKTAASEAITNSEIIECTVKDYYIILFPYSSMNEVMKILKDENIRQSDQVFELNCSIKISFRLSMRELILQRFSGIKNLTLHYLETR